MSNNRRIDVLRAIVSDYVRTREPVGSRALVDRYQLDVSPATIRNDMAALEEGGYLHQPHTSAGRVPTDKGYRLFVDHIAKLKPLSPAERRAVTQLLEGAVDLDDVVERTVRLLAQLTNQLAIIQYPSLRTARLKHIELVALAENRLLLVLITAAGRVDQQMIELKEPASPADLAVLRGAINLACEDREAHQIPAALAAAELTLPPPLRPLMQEVTGHLLHAVGPASEERIVVAGRANLARSDTDFSGSITPILEVLEEQVVLMRLLMGIGEESMAVRIGTENTHAGLAETTTVFSSYGNPGQAVAHVGIVGPTRMDYPSNMAAVRAVARYLTRFVSEES